MVHTNPYGASRCGSAHHGGKQMLSQPCPGSAVSHKLQVEVKVVALRCRSCSPVSGAVAPLCTYLVSQSLGREQNTRRRSVHHVKHVPSVSTFLFVCLFACSFGRHAVCVHKGSRRVCPDSGLYFELGVFLSDVDTILTAGFLTVT